MLFYDDVNVDTSRLPPAPEKLVYKDHSVVDGGGFSGTPGAGHAVPDALDPRSRSSTRMGRSLFEETVQDVARHVRETFGIA